MIDINHLRQQDIGRKVFVPMTINGANGPIPAFVAGRLTRIEPAEVRFTIGGSDYVAPPSQCEWAVPDGAVVVGT